VVFPPLKIAATISKTIDNPDPFQKPIGIFFPPFLISAASFVKLPYLS